MITVRFATAADILRVVRGLQNKGMNFNTTAQAKADILAGHLLVAEIDGRIVGSLAIVPTTHGYTSLKRGCVYNKKNQGKAFCLRCLISLCLLVWGTMVVHLGQKIWLSSILWKSVAFAMRKQSVKII